MATLKDILYYVSTALLYPCIVLLILFLGRTLVHLGAFLRECLDRRRSPVRMGSFVEFVAAHRADAIAVEKRLDEVEAEMTREVDATSLLSRIGPMLGLAGTLIPLGPALKGMASGDVGELAENLIVAFTTTVVGLAIAGPCYWISVTRRRWYDGDLREMEYHFRGQTAGVSKEA